MIEICKVPKAAMRTLAWVFIITLQIGKRAGKVFLTMNAMEELEILMKEIYSQTMTNRRNILTHAPDKL